MNRPFIPPEEASATRSMSPDAVATIVSLLDDLRQVVAAVPASPSAPDTVVTDLEMPEVEGKELLKAISDIHDVGVTVLRVGDDAQAVTRTERHDDLYELALSVNLEGLDLYEVRAIKRVLPRLRSLIAIARQGNSETRITQLLRAVAPFDSLSEVELKVAEDTVDLRREFLRRFPVLTSAEVHRAAGYTGEANPSQTVHRWRKSGKIFSVRHGGRERYPAFQFGDDGQPLPIVGEVLAILRRDAGRTDWDNALWFGGDSGWLDGAAPVERLESEPELVKQAAEQEVLRDDA